MRFFLSFFATGCFSGKLPLAPGTWGSGVGVGLYLILRSLPPASYAACLVTFIVFSIWVASQARELYGSDDPPIVVIDEMAGILVTFAFLDLTWGWLIAGFALFRALDVIKPFPCRLIDRRLKSGWGIVLDDVMAGVYANLILRGALLIM